MGNQMALTIIFLVAFLLLLVFNELVYRRLNLNGELTRKFAHFSGTLSTITFPYLFTNHWYVFSLALIFFALLFISRNYSYLKSIHDIKRISVGSYLLPVAIYITFLVSLKVGEVLLFILPIMVLAISDPMAGMMGINLKQYNHKVRIGGYTLQKTWLGSASFFISCFFISIIGLYFYYDVFYFKVFWLSCLVALTGTITEMLSWKGTDNLFIPLSVLAVLAMFY
jgi:phytol kinase